MLCYVNNLFKIMGKHLFLINIETQISQKGHPTMCEFLEALFFVCRHTNAHPHEVTLEITPT